MEQLLIWLDTLPRFASGDEFRLGLLVGLGVGLPVGMAIERGISKLAYWVVRRRYGTECR